MVIHYECSFSYIAMRLNIRSISLQTLLHTIYFIAYSELVRIDIKVSIVN